MHEENIFLDRWHRCFEDGEDMWCDWGAWGRCVHTGEVPKVLHAEFFLLRPIHSFGFNPTPMRTGQRSAGL
jgi:hypothetical protein